MDYNTDGSTNYDPYPMSSPQAKSLVASMFGRQNRQHQRQCQSQKQKITDNDNNDDDSSEGQFVQSSTKLGLSSSSGSSQSSSNTDYSSSTGDYGYDDNNTNEDEFSEFMSCNDHEIIQKYNKHHYQMYYDTYQNSFDIDMMMMATTTFDDGYTTWTTMDLVPGEHGPSEAAIARLRGGGGGNGGRSDKDSLVEKTTLQGMSNSTTVTPAVMDDGEDDKDDDDSINDEDEFLDRPTYESRSRGIQRIVYIARRLLERIVYKLYGNTLPINEFIRTIILASTLFFMIGGYWLLRSLKDPVITALCGVSAIPKAKMLSVFIVLGVVTVYNYLLDTDLPKHKLFYLFGTFYFCLFTFISLMLLHPVYGLANEQPSPYRVLGWISYCSIESFGSVMVTLFWSFANSNISLETAKASYGLMVATAQVGSILGPTFVQAAAPRFGVAPCYMMGAITMLLLQGSMYTYVSNYGTSVPNNKMTSNNTSRASTVTTTTTKAASTTVSSPAKKKEKAGILEGLQLLWTHNYVKGIFAISCFFMIEVTILDYTMKVLARDFFASEYPCESTMSCYDHSILGKHGMSQAATISFSSFMGTFGQATNLLSFSLSLFGTSAVLRYLGLRLTLLLFPCLCLATIIFVRINPTLYVVFGAMMILKANSYALNNPTKEILYQPTSPAVKYKAKSWIDIFGDRVAKATGSLITNAFSDNTVSLISNGSLVGMVVASFLIWNATYMGRTFDDYTETGYIVGGDKTELEALNIHMATQQNNSKNTSCAILINDDNDDDNDNDDEDNINIGLEHEQSDVDDDNEGKDFAKKPEVVMV
jgi:ATP:ADP antiporter, AAA family